MRGLARAATAGEQIVDAAWQSTGETTHGRKYTFAGGRAGYDLALPAALAKYELGAQLSDQVIYPNTRVDDHNQPRMSAVFEVKKEISAKVGATTKYGIPNYQPTLRR